MTPPRSYNVAQALDLWRARQIVTAGYTVAQVSDLFGFAPDVAEAAFIEAYPEVAQ